MQRAMLLFRLLAEMLGVSNS